MAGATNTTRFRMWLWLIRFVGLIVPRRLRADWRQEWEAELRRREEMLAEWERLDWRNKLNLLLRSASAFWDALWPQPRRLEDEMFQDLRFGMRMLLRSKMLTLVAALSLGLGIGATSSIYALIDQLLLHDITAHDPERLVYFFHGPSSSYLNFQDIRASGVFAELAAHPHCYPEPRWRAGDQTYPIVAQCVSGNYFSTLGVQAARGRVFTEDEAAAEKNPRVVVISHSFWQQRLGGDANVIGRSLTLNHTTYTIIGVLAANYRQAPEVIVPLSTDLYPRLFERDSATMTLIGRLAPGGAIAQTQQALLGVLRGLQQQFPDQMKLRPDAPPKLTPAQGLAKFEWGELNFHTMLGAVAVLVLLIACANVAGLLLARGAARQREIAIMPFNFSYDEYTVPRADAPEVFKVTAQGIGPAYLKTMGIPLLAGRELDWSDVPLYGKPAPQPAIINQAFAQKYFPDHSPVGQRLLGGLGGGGKPIEIVGVAANTSFVRRLGEAPAPLLLPLSNLRHSFLVRVTGSPAVAAPKLANLIEQNVPGAAVGYFTGLERLDLGIRATRLATVSLGALAALGLLLALIGLCAISIYNVTRRTPEIGIRMALGATAGNILRLMLRENLSLVAAGAALGALGWLALMRLSHGFLAAGVSPLDPLAFAAMVGTLVISAVIAVYIPARRAAQVDPMVTLRHE